MTATPIPTLFAYDGSGSTGGKPAYHAAAQHLLAELPVKSTQILFWDSGHRLIPPAELREINRRQQGYGGTDSSQIAQFIVRTGFHGHLVLLTDGEVSAGTVATCDSLIPPGWTFESVRVLIVETGGTANLSVSCPFTRNSPHTVHLQRYGALTPGPVTTVTAADLDTLRHLETVNTIAEWHAIAPSLELTVLARTMGTAGDPTLRDRLLALKARIQRAEAIAKGASDTVTALHMALEVGNIPGALHMADTLTREYYGEDEADAHSWSSQINRLVSMCEGALRGTFDLSNVNGAIQSDRARRAPAAREAPASAATEADKDASESPVATTFTCPITMEDATADVVLLIADADQPLLAGLDKDTVTDLTNCPLNIFRYPEVLANLQTRLDHPLSLRALKEAEAAGAPITASPMTRAAVCGALCLGPHADHTAATNWTIAQLTAGGRRMGSPDLWFAIIWLLVQRGTVPFLTPILPQLTAHLQWRFQQSRSSLSLLGTPEFPTTRVPLGVALWYAVASSALSPPPARETARAHLPYLEALLDLQRQTGYALPEGLSAHLTRLRVAMSMLGWCKRSQRSLGTLLASLVQASVRLGDDEREGVFVDGPASAEQIASTRAALPALFRELTDAELIGIGRLVSPGKSGAEVVLPFDWTPPAPPTARVIWAYGLEPVPRTPIPVCPATCRPYYRIRPDRTQIWEEAATSLFRVAPNRLLPVHTEFGHYVVKHGVFPSKTDLLRHLSARATAQGKPTLPATVAEMVEDILRDFEPITTTLTPVEVARRFTASVRRADRERLEAT
jgi:hypothetical protein